MQEPRGCFPAALFISLHSSECRLTQIGTVALIRRTGGSSCAGIFNRQNGQQKGTDKKRQKAVTNTDIFHRHIPPIPHRLLHSSGNREWINPFGEIPEHTKIQSGSVVEGCR